MRQRRTNAGTLVERVKRTGARVASVAVGTGRPVAHRAAGLRRRIRRREVRGRWQHVIRDSVRALASGVVAGRK